MHRRDNVLGKCVDKYILACYVKTFNLSHYYPNQTVQIIVTYVDECNGLFAYCVKYIVDVSVGFLLMHPQLKKA
jgi:hypothetical protein